MTLDSRKLTSVSPTLTILLGGIFAFLLAGFIETAEAQRPYELVFYDGHMHTNRSDGNGEVADIKAAALGRGLSVVFVTDHCELVSLAEWETLLEESAAASDEAFLVLPGVEVGGSEGALGRDHINALGIIDPFVGDNVDELCPSDVWPSPANPLGTGPMYPENMAAWVDYIHAQGGIATHNHPIGHTLPEFGVDNLEVFNQIAVDDFAGRIASFGVPYEQAWWLSVFFNNFSVYGERDLMFQVEFPGIPGTIPLRMAFYLATLLEPPYIGQIIGWGSPDPMAPGDLNSWDELLMAYVEGSLDRPIYGVANSDAHNTADADSNVGRARNGIYVKQFTRRGVLEAIKAGRSFATTGPILGFSVNQKPMGDTVQVPGHGAVTLDFEADSGSPTSVLLQIDILKNGQMWERFEPLSPSWAGVFEDTVLENGYYRVEVMALDTATGEFQFAYTNPVFMKIQPRAESH